VTTGEVSRRFRPARLGLTSIAEYVDETFSFAGGRLVLQGHNGAGKSKALELSVPLLFSGETRPRTLDTFGGQSKKLKDVVLWSLSSKQTFTQRTGWVWLELALAGDGDAPVRHVTLGAGMHAHRDWQDVRTRFFVLDGPRVGIDVHLSDGRDVVTFPHLRETLGEEPGARIVDGAREFRQLQDELLFGFGDEDRYQVMLRLLLALRRPNLSENMQPETIGELLRETLPPVDAALVGRIGALLEELERIGEEQREAERAAEAVRSVHEDYRELAAAIAHERAGGLRDAAGAQRRADRQRDAAAAEHERRSAALGEARTQRAAAEKEASDVGARLRELRGSPEARAARDLEHRGGLLAAARLQVESLRASAAAAEQAAAVAHEDLERVRANGEQALDALSQATADAEADAVAAGVEGHAAATVQAGEDDRALTAALRALVVGARMALRGQRELDGAFAEAAARQQEALARRDAAAAERAARAEARGEGEREAERAAEAHVVAVERWAQDVAWVEGAADLAGIAAGDGGDEAPGRAAAARAATAEVRRLDRASSAALERAQALSGDRDELQAERDRLHAARDPHVPAPRWRRREADAPAGEPFWRLVDFRSELDGDARRGGLEGALEASGLLDALVVGDGTAWRDGDVLLTPRPIGGSAATLADVLAPDAGCDSATAERVAALLRSVGLGPEGDAAVWCAPDGRFALGPARGMHALAAPALIGAAARERLRAEQLAALEQRIAGLRERIDAEHATANGHERERTAVEEQLARYPDPAALRAAVRAAHTLARDERNAAERERDAQRLLDVAREHAERAV
jgi:hypothetical protein